MRGLLIFAIGFLKERKLRSMLTILGIALGTALIFSIQITKQSTINSLSVLVSDLSGSADIQITGATSAGFKEQYFEKARRVSGVKEASPSLTRLAFILTGKQKEQVQVLGILPSIDKNFRGYNIVEAKFISNDKSNEVLLVKSWAKDHNIWVGDKIKITTSKGPQKFIVTGFIAKTGPGNVYDGALAIIHLKTAQDVFLMKGLINHTDVKVSDDSKINSMIKRLEKNLGSSFIVERPSSKGSAIETTTQGLMQAFNSFGILALLVGAFVVFNTMSMSITERRKQIGLLRAIGATRGQMMSLILLEAVIFGFIGASFGLFIGRLLAGSTSQATASIYKTFTNKTSVPYSGMMMAFSAGMIASIVAAFMPAWQASTTSPILAIKNELLKGKNWLERKGWVAGAALIFASALILVAASQTKAPVEIFNFSMVILFIGVALFSIRLISPLAAITSPIFKLALKPEGHLAHLNILRNKNRSSLATVIISMGLVLIISAGALGISNAEFVRNWLDSIVRVDLFIRTPVPFNPTVTGAYPRMNPDLINKIKQIDGIKSVTPATFLSTRGAGRDLFTSFVDPKGWKKTSRISLDEGNKEIVFKRLENPNNIIISRTIASKEDLHLNDKIKIKTAKGDSQFKIIGIMPDFANDGYSVYLNRKALDKFFNVKGVDTFNMLIKKGHNIDTLKKKLRKEIGNPNGLVVISGLDLRKDINRSVDQFLSLISSIALIAVLVSSLGIVNTLTMNVLERIKEIGTLRAAGMTRLQVSKTIIAEGGIIGTAGAIMGVALGLAVSKVVIVIAGLDSGLPLKYILPVNSIIFSAGIAVIVSLLSAIFPAYKASKIDIVKAVQYE